MTLQAFTYKEVHRSQIHPAPYNPRTIDPNAEARLEHNLRTVGLLTTLVWNERSGNLVGGHQRLSRLDKLEGTLDYELGVAAIDVDEQTERELNVALNNSWMQGEMDPDKLVALLPEVPSVEAMGYSNEELLLEFGARDELQHLVPPRRSRQTAQDTVGPHVLLVFRHNADKEQFLRHLGRHEDLKKMGVNELRDYLQPSADWRR